MTRENVMSQFLEARLKQLAMTELAAPLIASSNLQQGPDRAYADFFWSDGVLFLLMEIKPDLKFGIEEARKPVRQALCERFDVDDEQTLELIQIGAKCHWLIYQIDVLSRPIADLTLAINSYLPFTCSACNVERDWSGFRRVYASEGARFESAIVSGAIGSELQDFKKYIAQLGTTHAIYANPEEYRPEQPLRTFDGLLLVWDPSTRNFMQKIFKDFDALERFIETFEDIVEYRERRPIDGDAPN